ncbi:MAG: repressor LexA [Elusimicrobia bacterium RIFCSPLOWO2_02_FULL_39_32]|nr:MAG: repressor LexA [Elusimicrobia bacterium RIFCSPHIGHO2_02_FULL_39_36]OGR93634.1 MAG: repressor LexA [Elusimicrobia bacterium RIFCSPLOWO2_02_FULL_39_32]OGS00456.1 MAG: repressor LexA [Elusimicrobia bacterium RIFCSPLOWO2_12_FULL_39_28]
MEPLTEQEKKIFNGILSFIRKNGYTPSQRELAEQVGFKSPNTIDYHLKRIEKKGYLHCPKGQFRTIELRKEVTPFANAVRIPVLGQVPAGEPQLALEEYDRFIDLDSSLAKGPVFALEVKGDSMQEAGIFEKDIVVVKIQQFAENGEIVVARYGDETTVKYFKKKGKEFYLVPANPKYKPILAKGAEIVGKVVGLIRKYSG